jgi:hypothetical protein
MDRPCRLLENRRTVFFHPTPHCFILAREGAESRSVFSKLLLAPGDRRREEKMNRFAENRKKCVSDGITLAKIVFV